MPESQSRPLRVFLCHSSNDKPIVRDLYGRLEAEGWMDIWLDEAKLYPGQDWNFEIEQAVEAADIILVCLTKNSVTKEGYVQRELKIVLDLADYKPEGTLFVIPVRLEQCEPPRRLRSWHYADYFPEYDRDRAYQRLLFSLRMRAELLGISTTNPSEQKTHREAEESVRRLSEEKARKEKETRDIKAAEERAIKFADEKVRKEKEDRDKKNKEETHRKPVDIAQSISVSHSPTEFSEAQLSGPINLTLGGLEFVRVPKGKFLMGSKQDNGLAYDDEKPQHIVNIPYDYWIGRFPITNAQYAEFSGRTLYGSENKKNHPVVEISWNYAQEYVAWLNHQFGTQLPRGYTFRLPTEAEWEKAARGTDGLEWPWGNDFSKNKCNSSESGKNEIVPVTAYSPQGDSPYGLADLSGNTWEWTSSLKKDYPYVIDDGREDENLVDVRVLRGGSFLNNYIDARAGSRGGGYPDTIGDRIGIRIAVAHALG